MFYEAYCAKLAKILRLRIMRSNRPHLVFLTPAFLFITVYININTYVYTSPFINVVYIFDVYIFRYVYII